MKFSFKYIYSLILAVIAILSFVSEEHRFLSFALVIVLVLMMLNKMGKGIVLRESIAVLYVLTCITMPLIGYMFYTKQNYLSRLWVKYMPIPEVSYYEYTLPAIALFCLAITWPLSSKQKSDEGSSLAGLMVDIRSQLERQPKSGLYLIGLGMLVSLVVGFLPAGLQFVATIFFLVHLRACCMYILRQACAIKE